MAMTREEFQIFVQAVRRRAKREMETLKAGKHAFQVSSPTGQPIKVTVKVKPWPKREAAK